MVASDRSAIILRARGSLELRCLLDGTDGSHVQKAVSRAFERVRARVTSQALVFRVRDSPMFIWPNKGCQVTEGIAETTACKDLQQRLRSGEPDGGKRSSKKKDKRNGDTSVINIDLLMELTEPGREAGPTLTRREVRHHLAQMALPVDCVVTAGMDDGIGDAFSRLVGALCSQLTDMESAVLRHISGTSLLVPQPFHFHLPEPTGLVTLVYPTGVPDAQLESFRKEMHVRFALPEDRPYLRRANAYHFPGEPFKDGYLRNPHLALSHPALEDAKPFLVQGVYSYHHYMQDRMDDSGWGCAYRSLQTICSWFQQQGYTERVVPSHKEIQQALVDVGDKPSSFVGSRQWIGSIEVQAVLDQLLGITSRILFVSQGSELVNQGRELASHFQREGTPIMIGGGVLAHTILGVLWSETTGDIRFLILDPHYTGGEDLQLVTDKGWCGWKGMDFWDQRAYYNLCLPQRPRAI
ncbi:ufm1-specific protease 2 [Paramormyrops kingsleyae]|uniref:Ufm1-specific protease 2 n=1 Tax=Paramormyrops kingsleyae TaxID=1676925 RepID=A0A3B3QML3_9TELE|nr:ufm1-specific protease 2 [Paramormyrops kingsleyae]